MNLMNTAKSNANNLLSAVKELIEYAKFNKSFKAKIVGVFPNGKYKISYKNIEYPAKSEYQHNVGDSVWVCAPCNNWNELYIQSGNHNDNTELINQITELNNEVTELETEITTLKTQLTQTNSNLTNSLSKLPTMVQRGRETITPSAANVATSKDITFPTPFPGVPSVVATIRSSVAGTTVLGVGVTNESTTGFTLWTTRSNTTNTVIEWIAVY